ncbi:hypothetical protein O6H91_Y121500 [Diphasiastrum complanatum]|nr:hypothetical protein O6H91_Y121500 [Diphasiastrum complanatum]
MDSASVPEIIQTLQYLTAWLQFMVDFKNLTPSQAVTLAANGFTGNLKYWWEHLPNELVTSKIFQSVNPSARFIEAIYAEFIGSKTDEATDAKEAFNRVQLCDINLISEFIHYCKQLIYKFQGNHDQVIKLVFIHKLPQSLSSLVLQKIADKKLQWENVTLGLIQQLISQCIANLCTLRSASKAIAKSRPSTSFCKSNHLTKDFGCYRAYNSCSCLNRKLARITRRSPRLIKKPAPSIRKAYRSRVLLKKRPASNPMRCVICRNTGHWAKDCPKRKSKPSINNL